MKNLKGCFIKTMSITICITIGIVISCLLTSCSEPDYSDYKNQEGYEEYVSYADKGCEYLSCYNIPESIIESDKALKYYKSNVRQCGDFLITNYLDGICINSYIGENDTNEVFIPETLDGRPVIALGAYYNKHFTNRNSDIYDIYLNPFSYEECSVLPEIINLPSTMKYIGTLTGQGSYRDVTDYILGNLEFVVDEDNPYYASEINFRYVKFYS